MPINLSRKFIDLIRRVSREWTNWDSPIPVNLGDFGTLDENVQFIVHGNIYSDEFQQYLKGIKSSLDLNTYPAKFTEFEQDYTTFSSGIKREQLVIDKFVNVPAVASASFKETWTFQDGKRGALLILISSYTVSIQEVILAEILDLERLEGKCLVTTVRVCPAYLKFLSSKSEEAISVTFSPPASGVDIGNAKGTGWWMDAQSVLLRLNTQPHGKPIFTLLFSLKQYEQSRWQDVYPPWGSLDEDGKESFRISTSRSRHNRKFIDLVYQVSGKWVNWDPPIPVNVGNYGILDENGEFNIDGNIYSDEFQKYLDDHGFNFVARDYGPKLSEVDQDYTIASSGVAGGQLNVDQPTNPVISSASIKGTWKFRDGKRDALIILVNPRTSFIPNEIMTKILNVELLKGKYIVNSALACPAYLMYLSNRSGESFSVAFCAKAQGDVVDDKIGGEWWTENEAGLLRRGSHPNGKYLFTPLFTLKQTLKRSWLPWRWKYEEQATGEEYSGS